MLLKHLKYFLALLFAILHIQSFGQSNLQNLLDQMQDKCHGETPYWIEDGNYYYFVSCQRAGAFNNAFYGWPSQYFITKYNKNTLQKLDQKYIAGDTLNSDSITFTPYIALRDKQFYIYYFSQAQHGNTLSPYYHFYQRLDIYFNTLVAAKEIEDSSRIDFTLSDCIKPMDNSNFFIGYQPRYNSGNFTNYLMLDSMGNTIRMGAAGYNPANQSSMRGFTSLGNNKYLISGYGFAGAGNAPNNFGWCLVNDSMQILDTFKDKFGLVQDPVVLSYILNPGTIALPGGSLITATGTTDVQGTLGTESDYPLIRKHTAASHYGVDKFIVSGPIDNTDTAHENLGMPVSIMYNPIDNTIYYASVTHQREKGLSCAYNSDKAFLEVISLDTNLNIKWKKYFKMTGTCSRARGINPPDVRTGAIVTGYNFFVENNQPVYRDWVYYINDATPSDTIPTSISEEAFVNAGFKVYPNPAADVIHIITENATLKSVAICDITGRVLFEKALSGQEATVNIGAFPKGLYILKCVDKEGKVFVNKVVKE